MILRGKDRLGRRPPAYLTASLKVYAPEMRLMFQPETGYWVIAVKSKKGPRPGVQSGYGVLFEFKDQDGFPSDMKQVGEGKLRDIVEYTSLKRLMKSADPTQAYDRYLAMRESSQSKVLLDGKFERALFYADGLHYCARDPKSVNFEPPRDNTEDQESD